MWCLPQNIEEKYFLMKNEKRYYVDTVGKNTAAIKSYIVNQLKQDQEMDQLSSFDPRDPFTGSK